MDSRGRSHQVEIGCGSQEVNETDGADGESLDRRVLLNAQWRDYGRGRRRDHRTCDPVAVEISNDLQCRI
jgi:hypothetical protein